jgi:PPOX class probable F420-dependent enzyme
MGVTLSPDDAWALLTAAHTGILGTVRRDGEPSCLPTWFVVLDRVIYVRARAGAAKVRHILRDGRVCFLVEAGTHWKELRAVMVTAEAAVVADENVREAVIRALEQKYDQYRTPRDNLPAPTRAFYSAERVILQLRPHGKLISWDNRRLGVQ